MNGLNGNFEWLWDAEKMQKTFCVFSASVNLEFLNFNNRNEVSGTNRILTFLM